MLDGVDDMTRSLRALARECERGPAVDAVKAGLDVLLAAVERRTPRLTGALLAAEAETPVADRNGFVSGSVTVASGHAAAVEFGTHSMAAQPYMRPAFKAEGPAAVRAAGAVLDAWAKGITT